MPTHLDASGPRHINNHHMTGKLCLPLLTSFLHFNLHHLKTHHPHDNMLLASWPSTWPLCFTIHRRRLHATHASGLHYAASHHLAASVTSSWLTDQSNTQQHATSMLPLQRALHLAVHRRLPHATQTSGLYHAAFHNIYGLLPYQPHNNMLLSSLPSTLSSTLPFIVAHQTSTSTSTTSTTTTSISTTSSTFTTSTSTSKTSTSTTSTSTTSISTTSSTFTTSTSTSTTSTSTTSSTFTTSTSTTSTSTTSTTSSTSTTLGTGSLVQSQLFSTTVLLAISTSRDISHRHVRSSQKSS
ncbi:unnamed protein product [Penicillium salamii]|nr:unnamed protein product [Penicillium salamii]